MNSNKKDENSENKPRLKSDDMVYYKKYGESEEPIKKIARHFKEKRNKEQN